MKFLKKTIIALCLSVPLVSMACTPWPGPWSCGWHHWHHHNNGAAIAVGIGILAGAAIIAGIAASQQHSANTTVVYQPRPAPVKTCWVEKRHGAYYRVCRVEQ